MSTDPYAELDELIRRRYEVAFGGVESDGVLLRVTRPVLDALRARTAPPIVGPDFGAESMMRRLTGLPVHIDDTLPPGTWQLIDGHNNVLRQGVIQLPTPKVEQ